MCSLQAFRSAAPHRDSASTKPSLPSHHLWPQRESAAQIQNWCLHLAAHWSSTDSEGSPLLRRGHGIRQGRSHENPHPFWSRRSLFAKPASPTWLLTSASTLLLEGLVFQLRPRLPHQRGLVCVLSQGGDILQFWDLCLESQANVDASLMTRKTVWSSMWWPRPGATARR